MESPNSDIVKESKSLFLLQLELAEMYILQKLKEPARLALLIVRELWEAEKPDEEKERYNNAVKALKKM